MVRGFVAHSPSWSIDVVVDLAFGDLAKGFVGVVHEVFKCTEVRVVSSVYAISAEVQVSLLRPTHSGIPSRPFQTSFVRLGSGRLQRRIG
jgi:hypothetical protein